MEASPRYAAQREASMAESLAYVAARLGGSGSETWIPKDGNNFH